jgi:hypothetical protein
MFCLSDFKQLNFYNQISEIQNLSYQKPVRFLKLLKENFDINTFISKSFLDSYYLNLGCNRKFDLSSILSSLIIMHIFKIPTTTLLCVFLSLSTEIRDFCQFNDAIPDETFFSRFKTSFEKQIADFFNSMALNVNEICITLDESLPKNDSKKGFSSMLIYDTSGLKPKVKENNPKTLASEIKKQKVYAKIIGNKAFNPYAVAYKNMPKFAESNSNIRLDFVNGHFGYFYKFGMLTNGLGIPLKIHFFDDDFYSSVKSHFETPEEQKYNFDNASLKPVLQPFLKSFPFNNFKIFLGDSEFDSYDNFAFLKSCKFQKVFIPINNRNTKNLVDSLVNADGTPICPLDKSLFLPDGSCKGKNRSLRLKYVCPKSIRIKTNWKCLCENPCRETKSTVTIYKYPDKNFRLYPGVQRCSDEWNQTYKIRASIERELSSLKKNPCIESPRTTNTTTMRTDLYLSAITKLITVILANSINKPQYLRNISKIIKFAA